MEEKKSYKELVAKVLDERRIPATIGLRCCDGEFVVNVRVWFGDGYITEYDFRSNVPEDNDREAAKERLWEEAHFHIEKDVLDADASKQTCTTATKRIKI